MKFKSPPTGALPGNPRERSGASRGKPEWLKEWLANKGRFVMLTCGHEEDLNDKALLMIYVFGKHGKATDVLCERCNQFVGVKGPSKPPPNQVPDEPMF